jgi:hypothetical protein
VGAYALHHGGETDHHLLLGRINARVIMQVEVGERCVVAGWPTGRDDNRLFAATCLFNGQGWVAAVAKQVWFPAQDRVPGA